MFKLKKKKKVVAHATQSQTSKKRVKNIHHNAPEP